jgi:hypothetical protein
MAQPRRRSERRYLRDRRWNAESPWQRRVGCDVGTGFQSLASMRPAVLTALGDESLAQPRASLLVIRRLILRLCERFWVQRNGFHRPCARLTCANASLAGVSSTASRSTSSTRRRISSFHAASISASRRSRLANSCSASRARSFRAADVCAPCGGSVVKKLHGLPCERQKVRPDTILFV